MYDMSATITQMLTYAHTPGNFLSWAMGQNQVGVIGHSDGGMTVAGMTMSTSYNDPRIKVAAVMAGAGPDGLTWNHRQVVPTLIEQATGTRTTHRPTQVAVLQRHRPAQLLDVNGRYHIWPLIGNDQTSDDVRRAVIAQLDGSSRTVVSGRSGGSRLPATYPGSPRCASGRNVRTHGVWKRVSDLLEAARPARSRRRGVVGYRPGGRHPGRRGRGARCLRRPAARPVGRGRGEAGPQSLAVRCDVMIESDVEDAVAATVETFGGLDAVVYATAIDPLVRIADVDAAAWTALLATNVVGASLVTRAALPHLREVHGRVLYVSATSVGRPLPGMGAYATSKAALEELARAWRSEYRDVSFCTVAVGMTLGTGVGDSWNPALLGELSPDWSPAGYLLDNGPGTSWTCDEVADALLAVLASPTYMPYVAVLPDPARSTAIG